MWEGFFQTLQFGTKVTAHGMDWQVVHTLPGGYALAIRADGGKLPVQVHVIQPEVKAKPNETVDTGSATAG